jgi:hypothetical protein
MSYLVAPGTTAEQLAAQRELAQKLLMEGSSTAPVGHWTQGLARVLQGGLGGWELGELGGEERKQQAGASDLLQRALGSLSDTGVGASAPQGGAMAGQAAGAAAAGPSPVSPAIGAAAAAGRANAMPMNMDDVVTRLIGTESGGNDNAKASTSSAAGRGQFINSTWLDMVKRNAPNIAAGKSDAELLALRSNPALSTEMTKAYAAENAQALQASGLPVTPGTIKLSHFLGPAGARSVLSSRDSVPVAQVLTPGTIQANPFLANMTVGDVKGWADRQMAREARVTGGAPSSQAAAPAEQPAALSDRRYDSLRQRAQMLLANPRTQKIGQELLLKLFEQEAQLQGGGKEYGTTAQYRINPATGKPQIGQLSTHGGIKWIDSEGDILSGTQSVDTATGTQLRDKKSGQLITEVPKDLAGKERAEVVGKASGQAEVGLPGLIQTTQTMLGDLDYLQNNPERKQFTGWRGNLLPSTGIFSSEDSRDYQGRLDQLKSGSFVSGVASLKGLGALSDAEGKRLEFLQSRLSVMGPSDKGFDDAINEYRTILQRGIENAQRMAAGHPNGPTPGNPDQPRAVKTLKYNAQTGELE